ncbi:spore gernimation protein [Paenibacillus helianthi]|uniref:Spore gernimation protein n=1 Tax=Paenibacillus helianthi TaxID=1349432 RepID=A0ABX3EJI7_9BACL|nr:MULTISPECIES: spore germination lipoprotein GerD [Paenibacillus]OKP67554.1 spore gernimation protein [Paenibacillus sp. P3E]OKP84255.1 spore gernimation protein [Paenibacillus helianthi]OKP87909.1 spore gernimation protein [Paenibacillus sp. P32E]
MKWRTLWTGSLLLSMVITLTACGSEQSSSSSGQVSYKEMKTMVVDILKSEEGKKAVQEALSAPSSGSEGSSSSGLSMKMMPMQTNEQIRVAVKDTITAPEYQKEIEKIMTDPQFAGDFAKAINSQNKELHLQLIKDPTYQKSVAEIMKSPEMMKMFLDLTKTSDYRKQSMTIMQEAMQNPLFRMEVLDLLKTVVQDELQPKVEKKDSGKEKGSSGNKGSDDSGS